MTSVFGRDAFRDVIRGGLFAADRKTGRDDGAQVSGTAGLRVVSLESIPDEATAWVYGLYALILRRLPDRSGQISRIGAIRNGAQPQSIARDLAESSEGRRGLAEIPKPLERAFVVGSHLTTIGEAPTKTETEEFLRRLDEGEAPRTLLDGLLHRAETLAAPRFPAPRPDVDVLVGELLQRIVLGSQPQSSMTDELAAKHAAGAPLHGLVRMLLKRQGGLRNAARSVLQVGQLCQAIEHRLLIALCLEFSATVHELQWRHARTTPAELDSLAATVGTILDRVTPTPVMSDRDGLPGMNS